MPDITKRELKKIIRRLEEIYEKLDGQKQANTPLGGDEFTNLQNAISEDIVAIRNKIKEKEKLEQKRESFIELTKLKLNIKNKFEELDSKIEQLERINKGMQGSAKLPEQVKSSRQQIVEKLKLVTKQLKKAYDVSMVAEDVEPYRPNVIKIGDMKNNLLKKKQADFINFEDSRDQVNTEDDDQIKKWRKKDDELDEKLDDVIVMLNEIKGMNEALGKEIDVRNQLVDEVNADTQKTNKAIELQNQQLAEVLKSYRAPSKLCLDCCMCILLVGLISVIVMLVKNGK